MNIYTLAFIIGGSGIAQGTSQTVMQAVDNGTLDRMASTAHTACAARPLDPEALARYTLSLVWQQRLGMVHLGQRPSYAQARRLRDLLEDFRGKRTLDLILSQIQFDHDFGTVVLDPGEGRVEYGTTRTKVTAPDGRVHYETIKTMNTIGPSDAQIAKQRERVETAIRMAPNDPEVLLLRASIAAKAKPEVAGQILARAEKAGILEIQPLSARILAWKVRKTEVARASLVDYLKRTSNDRITRTALRGSPELAELARIKP